MSFIYDFLAIVTLSSSSWRVFCIFLFLSQLVYNATYSACLISYLTTLSTTLPFYTLEEFVKDGSYEFATLINGATETTFLVSSRVIY